MNRVVRHQEAPVPSGCDWCGIGHREHGRRYWGTGGIHTYVPPTDAQILARMKARRQEKTS